MFYRSGVEKQEGLVQVQCHAVITNDFEMAATQYMQMTTSIDAVETGVTAQVSGMKNTRAEIYASEQVG